jgi:hypothetical protein
MGRILKQKRILIEEANRKMLNESEYGTDLDGGGEDNVEYNITLQLNRILRDEEGNIMEIPDIEAEELLDIPDSYEEGLKIFQQIKDKLERNKR